MSAAPKPPAESPAITRPAGEAIVGRFASIHGTMSATSSCSQGPAHSPL